MVIFIYLFKSLDPLPLLLLCQLSLEPLLSLWIFVAVIETTEGVECGPGEAFLQRLRTLLVRIRAFYVILDAVVLLVNELLLLLVLLIDFRKLAPRLIPDSVLAVRQGNPSIPLVFSVLLLRNRVHG